MLARSESDEAELNELVKILIESKPISGEVRLLLGLTSIAHYEYVLNWLLDNLTILNQSNNSNVLSFLENIISERSEFSEDVACRVLSILSWSKVGMFKVDVLKRLVAKIQDSEVTDAITESSAFTNAAFFGNYQYIDILLDNGFTLPPRIYQKAKGDYLDAMEKGKYLENSLFICRAIIDHLLIDVLNGVKNIIKTHPFVINGGGDNSIVEIGHAVTTHAAKVFNLIDVALKSDLPLTETYCQLATDIVGELRAQEKGWFYAVGLFTLRGERDPSTSACYIKITQAIMEGLTILSEYISLAEMRVDQAVQPHNTQESAQKRFSY